MASHTIPLKQFHIPADHQDLNHPHYPGHLEHQSGNRRNLCGKKRVIIAGGNITTILFIAAAVVWGVALTHKHNNSNGKEATEVTLTTNSSAKAPLDTQTVYKNATTVFHTTTRVPLLVAPPLATSTIIISPTYSAPEAPLRPVMASFTSVTITSPGSTPSAAASGDVSPSGCLFSGAWVMKEQCEQHCPSWKDHETHCEVSKRSQWVCISCPVRS